MLKGEKKYFIYVFIILLVSLFTCCSPKSNQRVLSFFFDGVPAQHFSDSSTVVKNTKDTANKSIVAKYADLSTKSIHPPYKEGNCTLCHNQFATGMLNTPQTELCFRCHENFDKKFAFVHAPVASGYCTGCHNPHISELPKLLVRKGQDICLHCHEAIMVLKNEVHAEIGETACTDCHNPHGGNDRYLFN